MRSLLFVMILLLVGCAAKTSNMVASMYSVSETGESAFDGTKWIKVKSIWCDPITFDIYQDTNLSKSKKASLELNIGGTHSIQSGKSLHLNIDGKFTDLSTLEKLTDIEKKPSYSSSGIHAGMSFYLPPHNVSSKRYLVDIDLLERMEKANNLIMRVDLARDYIDAVCTNEKSSGSEFPAASTSYGIRKFIENASQFSKP